jgi:CRISPR-associated protein Csb2
LEHKGVLVLRVTYLTGRVYSAVFEDGDDKAVPEWPPHPSRLFSALVAAWGDGGAEEDLIPVLEWLEGLGAPTIYAGSCTRRKLVKTFVPVNDSALPPEMRSRKARTFPSATLSHPDVYFTWDVQASAEVLSALDRILNRTTSLGHSSSLVAMEIVGEVPAGEWRVWVPGAASGTRLRVPYAGRLRDLMERYKGFEKDPNKIHRPSAGKTSLYSLPPKVAEATPQSIFERMIILRREEGPRGSLRSTLSVTSALRGAIMKFAPQPPPEFLSGHSPESTVENPLRAERPHVALVPLPFVGDVHANGDLLGVAVLLPRTLTPEERVVCWSVAGGVRELGMNWGKWSVSVTDAEERRRALLPETWVSPHSVWSTVTPFVFDRYPKEPYGEEAKAIVRSALVRIGLPEPCEVDLHYNGWHVGVPKASAFPPAARPGRPQRFHCHVWARFQQCVAGPVVAGAGRYYGYGLFRPLVGGAGAR